MEEFLREVGISRKRHPGGYFEIITRGIALGISGGINARNPRDTSEWIPGTICEAILGVNIWDFPKLISCGILEETRYGISRSISGWFFGIIHRKFKRNMSLHFCNSLRSNSRRKLWKIYSREYWWHQWRNSYRSLQIQLLKESLEWILHKLLK